MNMQEVKELSRIAADLGAAYPAGASNGENWGIWLVKVATLARRLRGRYLNACNYAWALTDKYEKGTERLEKQLCTMLQANGCKPVENYQNTPDTYTLQRDPRGASLQASVGIVRLWF